MVAISKPGTPIQDESIARITMVTAEPKPSLVGRLFAEHRAALQSFFLRRIRSKADAADLAQEVYVRMLRIRDLEAIRNPVSYLYTVANNLVKEHAVLDRRQASAVDIDEIPVQEQLGTLPTYDGDLDATQRVARLGVVLNQLRPKCRAAVELRFTQDSAIGRSRCTSGCHGRWRRSTWRRRSVIVDAAWRGWVEIMNSNEEKMRTAIAEQAGEWFVANDAGPLDAPDCAALAAWLKTSPVHIEEFLAVSAIARDLKEAHAEPAYSLAAILARARVEENTPIRPLWPHVVRMSVPDPTPLAPGRRGDGGVRGAGCGRAHEVEPQSHPAPDGVLAAALHLETRHGEQLTRRLADNSVLHLNTDSAVTSATAA